MIYQEKVSTRADVRALFEKVKQNPAVEKYRGFTDTKSYGWDEEKEDYIKMDGEVFFDNPAFLAAAAEETSNLELLEAEEMLPEECEEFAEVSEDEAEAGEAVGEGTVAVSLELYEKFAAATARAERAEAERDRALAVLSELREAMLVIKNRLTVEK